jgi:bacteriocin-like protein
MSENKMIGFDQFVELSDEEMETIVGGINQAAYKTGVVVADILLGFWFVD